MKTFTTLEISKIKKTVAQYFNGKICTKKRLEQFLLIEKNTEENKKLADLHKQLYG